MVVQAGRRSGYGSILTGFSIFAGSVGGVCCIRTLHKSRSPSHKAEFEKALCACVHEFLFRIRKAPLMATGVSSSAVHRCEDERDEDQPQKQPSNQPPRAPRQPHCGGYDCEFVKPPPVEFPQTDCPVCLLVLREPHQASCCGNSYCEACVKRVQEDKKCCPACNEADFAIFPDKRLKRSLYALNVYCCQRREGCEWKGELGELDRHLNQQPPPEKLFVGCQFAEVDCTYCVQPLQRRYVQAHQSDDCLKRPYTCQHCKTFAATFGEVTVNHWPVCSFFPLPCPNNCELVLQRQEVEHHVSNDCPFTLVQCDFHVVGCRIQLTRKDMPSHISENLTGHMSLLQVHMMTHAGENMPMYLLLMVGSIQKLVVENAKICSELHEAQEELQETRDELRETRQTVVKLEETVTSQHKSIVMYAKEMQESREKIQAQEATLNQHQRTLEKVTCTGTLPFEFTMAEFEQYKRANDVWYSPPFYTHTHGYRMRIKVWANGWESGKGTHVSVRGCLMQGDFDNGLYWPFEGAITIQLLNQLEDSNHQAHTFDFTGTNPDVNSRVTSGKTARKGYGQLLFISHTQLDLNTDHNCQFLKDNQLKFRVSKATNLNLTASIHRRCLTLESFAGALEPKHCIAPIEFTLSDFERQKEENNKWYSPAFYSHLHGYRMCLEVCPNGSSNGLGTHVSIYTCIMRGPFDSGLKWPMQGDITIQIVNQASEDNHVEGILTYSDETPYTSNCCLRMANKERAVSWGFSQFLSHSSLGYNAAMNTQYLRGDCLQIRISKVELKN